MSQNSELTTDAPAYGGYRPAAVSIRATYTVGDVTDELVVDIDEGPVDVAVIRGVIDAMTEKREPVDLETSMPGAQVYGIRRSGPQTVTNNTGQGEPVLTTDQWPAADKEAQA